jgi:serine/threonine protein kinase
VERALMAATPRPDLAGALGFEGRTLGGYRLARSIAAGGMAAVYLGRKTGPGGYVQNAAIKIIHPHLARDPKFVAMFLDEASIVSCINHPNVCRLLDSGKADDSYFLALEYVRGETWSTTLQALSDRAEVGAGVAEFAAYVVAQACEGLHAAHTARTPDGDALDVVHRDVSPENLFVAYDGSVRVLDFGVASGSLRTVPVAGAGGGRYLYMAPEQMGSGAVDRRADVWSLGVVLREALEGVHPFRRATDVATMYATTEEPLPAWSQEVPEPLRAIVDRALQRDLDAR